MQCSKCGHENRSGAKFCEECGTRLARTCPKCQGEISPSTKFCPECGEQVAAPTSKAARVPSPESYTPKHLPRRPSKVSASRSRCCSPTSKDLWSF